MAKQYVSAAFLAERYNVNRTTIWRWSSKGKLPRPVRFSNRCTRWDLEDIEKYDAEREV